EPDGSALPSDVTETIRALIQGCLRKDRRERIGDLSTARFLLNQPDTVAPDTPVTPPLPQPLWKRAIPIIVSVLIGAAAVAAVVGKSRRSPTGAVTRFVITLPPGQQLLF